jgi:UDP-N-acetylmuramate dehydrogenase
VVTALDAFAAALGPLAKRDAPLGARTTYGVGGTASVLVEAEDETVLERCHAALLKVGAPVPFLVVGRGSNLLVADKGFPGVALVLGSGFSGTSISGTTVTAGGAVGLQPLARETAKSGLSGFEWAVGVPGSVGGAVRMNAGGHGAEMADVLVGARIFDIATGSASWRTVSDLEAGYRHTSLGAADVVVSAEIALTEAEPDAALERVAEVVRWRKINQPGGSNAGSVFTNPPHDAAGRLVDAAGLKGKRVGSAEVSAKHANFFQADRHGSADDVKALIDHVRGVVSTRLGVELVPELRMVGFPGDPLPEVVVIAGSHPQLEVES